jgi:hypothetical protein
MTTTQLIEKKKKEFDKKFTKSDFRNINDWDIKEDIQSFLHSFALDLIETVSEEIITLKTNSNSILEGDWLSNRIHDQRQHKDQIINSIKRT